MKYKVIAYPNWDKYETVVEANSIEEALEEAEEEANMNGCFIVENEDIEPLEEVE